MQYSLHPKIIAYWEDQGYSISSTILTVHPFELVWQANKHDQGSFYIAYQEGDYLSYRKPDVEGYANEKEVLQLLKLKAFW